MKQFTKNDLKDYMKVVLDGWNILWKREEPKYILLFPKEMFGEQRKLYKYQGNYYSGMNGRKYNGEEDIFTQEEINEIPFSTDIFKKVEVEK